MKSKKSPLLLAAGLLAASAAQAAINVDTVSVGDAGNVGEVQSQGTFGAVSYGYHIGTYEVTNGQYTAFLNAKATTDAHALYNSNMGSNTHGGINQSGTSGSFSYSVKSGFENKPVNFVSFWDAARFSNWLTNGGGSGDTETGMYNLNGTTNPTNNTVTRQLDFSLGQNGVAIASENEWYKAAYYDGSGSYSLYPTQSNSITTADANYDNSVGTVTDVGAYAGDPSHYGTFDQGGNVWEWNDAIVSTSTRVMRGGSFSDIDFSLQSSSRPSLNPTVEDSTLGFRVTSLAPIPEPSAYAAILGCLGLGLALMRRKGRGTL
ncbi:MAG: formylglycine-generating enzyme family protein [Opitutales bacterium]